MTFIDNLFVLISINIDAGKHTTLASFGIHLVGQGLAGLFSCH